MNEDKYYKNIEEAFNEMAKFVTDLDKRLEKLTIAFNEKYINDAASLLALFKILNLSEDETLDFYNLVKTKTLELEKNISSTFPESIWKKGQE